MSPIVFLVLAGLAAVGFLVMVARRPKMPVVLRGILIVAAAAIAVYVAWTVITLLHAPVQP